MTPEPTSSPVPWTERLRFRYRGFKAQRRSQRLEIAALTHGVAPDSVLIDVGANKGSYLPALAGTVPQGTVFAFEPQPPLARYLSRLTTACGLQNVQVVHAGCSDAAGVLPLAIPGDADTSPGASFAPAVAQREQCRFVDVSVVRLDDFFATETRRVAGLKIDVEGHELAVLRGAAGVVAQHRPTIVCECEQRHLADARVDDLFALLAGWGYAGWFSDNRRLHPVSNFDATVHQPTQGERFWDRADYFNNFVFVHEAHLSRKNSPRSWS